MPHCSAWELVGGERARKCCGGRHLQRAEAAVVVPLAGTRRRHILQACAPAERGAVTPAYPRAGARLAAAALEAPAAAAHSAKSYVRFMPQPEHKPENAAAAHGASVECKL